MAAERPRDRYPLMTLEYVVKALKVLFGRDNVVSDKGEITARVMPGATGGPTKVIVNQPPMNAAYLSVLPEITGPNSRCTSRTIISVGFTARSASPPQCKPGLRIVFGNLPSCWRKKHSALVG